MAFIRAVNVDVMDGRGLGRERTISFLHSRVFGQLDAGGFLPADITAAPMPFSHTVPTSQTTQTTPALLI